ncbi:KinB-signaling pathway activation protein [Oceanobacillus saliphilus]|uniref:KinB-signaling pathway activation protein n=1 Tax=Oceanobacillus saliphilus TaxID=2925834 RepID=UPI00201D4F39|nr:KinB-signaling pathway activation protein [Oceanobacillus saliphilus]
MTSRKLVNFLFKTFIIGGVAGLLISFFVKYEDYATYLNPFDFMEVVGLVLFFIGLGLTFSVVSMTGFFAYLFIHRMGLNLFKSFWPTVQVLLIAFVIFDLIYFPYQATAGEVSVFWYILMAAALLGFGWIVAKRKAKETNKHAFIPALFFMVVITTVEWVPGLQVEGTDYAWLMIAPLLACNTYQLLTLHRITKTDEKKQSNAKSQPVKKASHKQSGASKV